VSRFAQLVLSFSALILVYDVVTALIARRTGLEYALFGLGAAAIYGWCGYLLGGVASPGFASGPAAMAASGAGTVALVEATVGWALAWRIGPGRLPPEQRTRRRIVRGISIAVVSAAAIGFLFGLIGSSLGTM
jgi:hypothetical protein